MRNPTSRRGGRGSASIKPRVLPSRAAIQLIKDSREETANILARLEAAGVETELPITRQDCIKQARPCPFVSCKYHLYLDVQESTKSIKLNFPDREVWEMQETCALDIADRASRGQEITLEKVGEYMGGITRERVRQIELSALTELRRQGFDWRWMSRERHREWIKEAKKRQQERRAASLLDEEDKDGEVTLEIQDFSDEDQALS